MPAIRRRSPVPRTIIEPFRIKVVEPIVATTREERAAALDHAGFNLFRLHARDVLIDLLTDSGTGAMSAAQWSAIMGGDESYAGAESYYRFRAAVRAITGFEEVIPTHQGRAAEHLLFDLIVKPGQRVISNALFDTTRANAEMAGAIGIDLPPSGVEVVDSEIPFKGDIDLEALERELCMPDGVAAVVMTLTNNSLAGQPVSLDNMRAVSELCRERGVRLFIDAARFAENAFLVRERTPTLASRTLPEIARAFFDLADGCTMSAKKDGMANIGGFLALRDASLAEEARRRLVVTEGFPTYGGLAGRDLDAIAVGLHEALEEDYQRYRHASLQYLGDKLKQAGVPHVRPVGGHAVYLDAAAFLDHLSPRQLPGQVLAIALYLDGGIRSCEIGSVMFGHFDGEHRLVTPARQELVRLAFPRRVYTQSHADYVAEVIQELCPRRHELRPARIVSAPPVLRHFTARFALD
jgi:tyrosine phenol-lyase